ncbi:MAG: cytochrome c family protein [Proteobacteria bacterium]|nr:cytochrome c family protein [Pseudomonadota bacterium]MBU1689079.1 cytochrome c family protein [Pseudomonadota bacterium]
MTRTRNTFLVIMITLALSGWPPVFGQAETGPDSAELDTLAQLYDAVAFDHAAHVEMVEGNCARCHHHTTGVAPTNPKCLRCHPGGQEADSMACKDCHSEKRFESAYLAEIAANTDRFHTDIPGLKGAYHRNCLGCHQESGGPTGCADCHARNEKGDAFFSSGKYAPKSPQKTSGH